MYSNKDIFETFNQLNVLIIGDVMIDRYLQGKVDRISPEAPVPVVALQRQENRLGGAANVALNIKALGAQPFLCSVIGKDENAAVFLDLLPKQKINTQGILQSVDRQTTVKTRVIADNQHLLRVDQEDTHSISATETNNLLQRITKILDHQDIHVILFQDYNKGVLNLNLIRTISLEAIKREIPTIVDPKLLHFFEYKHVQLFKPNLKEVRSNLPFEVYPEFESLKKASDYIRNKLGNQYTLITLSEKGLYIDDASKGMIIPTQARNIADVCGAGDSVISIAALGLALSLDMMEIALLSNLAGGQVCEHVGVVPINKPQLKEEYLRLKQEINQLH